MMEHLETSGGRGAPCTVSPAAPAQSGTVMSPPRRQSTAPSAADIEGALDRLSLVVARALLRLQSGPPAETDAGARRGTRRTG